MRVGGTVVGVGQRPDTIRHKWTDRAAERPSQSGFGSLVQRAIDEVDRVQKQADEQAERLATGRSTDVHSAIIAMRKAELALELTAGVIRRAIEAYKEISRMQV